MVRGRFGSTRGQRVENPHWTERWRGVLRYVPQRVMCEWRICAERRDHERAARAESAQRLLCICLKHTAFIIFFPPLVKVLKLKAEPSAQQSLSAEDRAECRLPISKLEAPDSGLDSLCIPVRSPGVGETQTVACRMSSVETRVLRVARVSRTVTPYSTLPKDRRSPTHCAYFCGFACVGLYQK